MITFDKTYFNIEDTLKCGQTFAYEKYLNGYIVNSNGKFANIYYQEDKVVIQTEHEQFFKNYFDLDKDYAEVCLRASKFNIELLDKAISSGKGIRILKQDPYEMIISFLISQNNNIPRITSSIFYLCKHLGKKVDFYGERYAFPTAKALANAPMQLLKEAGLGYRSEYVFNCAKMIDGGELDIEKLAKLPTAQLKEQLLKVKGIGEKVANCITLFGFNRLDSFPVDTWIEKVYLEDFKGEKTSRENLTEYFINKFGLDSGIIQQYLFHYKRNVQGGK